MSKKKKDKNIMSRFSKSASKAGKDTVSFFRNIPKNSRNMLTGLLTFTKNLFGELKHIEWLSRKNTLRYGFFVLLFVIGGSILIAGLDFLFYEVLKFITN